MIALLRGELAYKSVDHVIVDTGGVGYRLFIPLSTFYALPDTGQVRLMVHTHVREDALLLFGFATPAERDMFVTLIGISGIGPKLALNILSHIPVADLQGAVLTGDLKRLSALPGIGKKTAERLVLELRGKLATGGNLTVPGGLPFAATPDEKSDIVNALLALGYNEKEAAAATKGLSADVTVSDGVRLALKNLMKG
jgi:Holliday junction DNA helicase RuvA